MKEILSKEIFRKLVKLIIGEFSMTVRLAPKTRRTPHVPGRPAGSRYQVAYREGIFAKGKFLEMVKGVGRGMKR